MILSSMEIQLDENEKRLSAELSNRTIFTSDTVESVVKELKHMGIPDNELFNKAQIALDCAVKYNVSVISYIRKIKGVFNSNEDLPAEKLP